MSVSAPPSRVGRVARRHRFGLAALALSILLYLVSVPDAAGSDYGGYVWAIRLFNHQVVIGILACGLSVVATCMLLRGWRLVLALLLAFGVGIWWIGSGATGAIFAPSQVEHLSGVENPDHTLQTHVLLNAFGGPSYTIQVEQTDRGLLNRRFTVGCISGDAFSIDELRWEDGALIVDSFAGAIAITIGEAGRPENVRSVPASSINEGSEGLVELYACSN